MQFLVTVLYLMFIVGMFTNHVGAGLIAFVAASFLVWAYSRMETEEEYREGDLNDISDDDIDPRIKS